MLMLFAYIILSICIYNTKNYLKIYHLISIYHVQIYYCQKNPPVNFHPDIFK